ncbi:MAG: hypothetical protein A3H69_01500 [Candidatus Sungbacteria bacterium RIFCSPLOWO2_02_FULL_47_9]|uniref:Uncharacterized protein n=1 Tax=Candidatus Sungbacteria bacterium RIFCSPHIGHO2_01_FULL_47_32 TaxID=1802264 RepID=A0A1G2K5J3_9BACT|nr:MAG: hypothetical protein UX72_C0009G0045 [Parcubacteria group bacterium GW2011_GWA2_47_10]OGZ94696.1 MAG: hypothetical protein A2633_02635 [Candidatus Sungbacteria bacterium RIFCSPHIGHO2_01_FULL_47_32]OGZ99541.1 MAG: hypothetical protein A3D57_00335 [Candidatus Sungbacteria bacterium RIFCSPHIGHO2_02_FULL_46_12]OHA05208.1 MAG: hypothetical protein A3A28_01970 [Candidatus Sungbacteria bacterium RIFCSPLOWO2_01_FULL_47_32]OHA11817.1 MAG: hypothetical protein A3H69_01500 [Candidatus Sungbacteria
MNKKNSAKSFSEELRHLEKIAKKMMACKAAAEEKERLQRIDSTINGYLSELCLTEKRLKEKMLKAASRGKKEAFFTTFEENSWVFLPHCLEALNRELANRQEMFSKTLGTPVTLFLESFDPYSPARICAKWKV